MTATTFTSLKKGISKIHVVLKANLVCFSDSRDFHFCKVHCTRMVCCLSVSQMTLVYCLTKSNSLHWTKGLTCITTQRTVRPKHSENTFKKIISSCHCNLWLLYGQLKLRLCQLVHQNLFGSVTRSLLTLVQVLVTQVRK